jgi:hypothetical protein
MCNPAIGAAIGLFGGVLQGIGAAQGHEDNAVSYEMKAKGLDRDIAAEKQSSAYATAAARTNIAKTQGNVRAGYAANGLALSGSAADVLRESATEGDLDVAAIQWNSQVKVGSLSYERDTYLENAKRERGAKGLAFLSGVVGGAAKFGGSFG